MARKSGSTLLDRIDSKLDFPLRRAACFNCGLVYNGYKRTVKCPKCKNVMHTDLKSRQTFITGSWIKMSDFKSENHIV